MNEYCSHLYRKACLDVAGGLTTKEREAFLFYCRDVLPDSIADICDRKDCDILEAFETLRCQGMFSYQDTGFLKSFLLIRERCDLLKVVKEFDVSRDLIWLLEELITSKLSGKVLCRDYFADPSLIRDGKKGTAMMVDYIHNLSVKSNGLAVGTRALIDVSRESTMVSIEAIMADIKDELMLQTSNSRLTWKVIASLIKFAEELAVLLRAADRTPTHDWEKDVATICNCLIEEVVPWITQNGGWVS